MSSSTPPRDEFFTVKEINSMDAFELVRKDLTFKHQSETPSITFCLWCLYITQDKNVIIKFEISEQNGNFL